MINQSRKDVPSQSPENPAQGKPKAVLNPRTPIEVVTSGPATTNDPAASDRRPVGGTPPPPEP